MDREDNLCPECSGFGVVQGDECIYQGNHWEPPEYADIDCPTCQGSGLLTECVSEEE